MRKALLVGALATVPLFVQAQPKTEDIQKPPIEMTESEKKAIVKSFLLGFAITTFVSAGGFGFYLSHKTSTIISNEKAAEHDSAKISNAAFIGRLSAFGCGMLLWHSSGLPRGLGPILFGGIPLMVIWDQAFYQPALKDLKAAGMDFLLE